VSGIHAADGFAGDLGGGSLELIDVRKGKLGNAATLPPRRLAADRCVGRQSQEGAGDRRCELARSIGWTRAGTVDFYAIGGTWRALARLHMTQTNYPLTVMHKYRIEELTRSNSSSALLDQQSQSSLAGIRDISGARRETIPYGALVLERPDQAGEARARLVISGVRHPRRPAVHHAERRGARKTR
jgi:exopolyphosphatase/guanosine-5'-triphosphate,3'-diphosphate pyrophosphatase